MGYNFHQGIRIQGTGKFSEVCSTTFFLVKPFSGMLYACIYTICVPYAITYIQTHRIRMQPVQLLSKFLHAFCRTFRFVVRKSVRTLYIPVTDFCRSGQILRKRARMRESCSSALRLTSCSEWETRWLPEPPPLKLVC